MGGLSALVVQSKGGQAAHGTLRSLTMQGAISQHNGWYSHWYVAQPSSAMRNRTTRAKAAVPHEIPNHEALVSRDGADRLDQRRVLTG